MNVSWPDFVAALGLLLVVEGILPFLSPASLRRAAAAMTAAPDATLRLAGAASMAAGVLLLWLVRA